jgi:pimeloyl-ACP methyl ester carboxylesterase
MRRVITITLGIPLLLLGVYYVLANFYTPDEIPADFDFLETDFQVNAVDGATLAGTQLVPVAGDADARALIVFVAERGLDRDWNSRSVAFRTGQRLARILGGAGYAVFRFDHRGAGASRASSQTLQDLNLMAADIGTIARHARQTTGEDQMPVYYLAHDMGCALLARALQPEAELPRPAGVILLSCASKGSLLENWGEKLLFNMRRAGVKTEIAAQAEAEWREYLRTDRLPTAFDEIAPVRNPPPDLVAFRESVRYLARPAMDRFREPARQIHLTQTIANLRARGVPVLHLLGEFDEELPPDAVSATASFASSAEFAASDTRGTYRFRQIPRMNHFLKEQDAVLRGPALLFERLKAWRRIQPEAVMEIRTFLAKDSPLAPLSWRE